MEGIRSKAKQTGLSSIGLLMILCIASFFLLCAFKLGPHYIDSYFVDASLDKVRDEGMVNMTNHQIREKITKHFTIDGIRDVDIRDIKIDREKDRVTLTLEYEKRFQFLGNADVVLRFNHLIDSDQK